MTDAELAAWPYIRLYRASANARCRYDQVTGAERHHHSQDRVRRFRSLVPAGNAPGLRPGRCWCAPFSRRITDFAMNRSEDISSGYQMPASATSGRAHLPQRTGAIGRHDRAIPYHKILNGTPQHHAASAGSAFSHAGRGCGYIWGAIVGTEDRRPARSRP
jgi:hypothetical protein